MNTEQLLESLSLESANERIIIWDYDSCIGKVNRPKGCVWNAIGVLGSNYATLLPEEVLFLAEFKNFEICDKYHKHITSADICKFSKQSSLHKFYSLYKYLKKHGFILMRPESKYFPRSRLFIDFRPEYSIFKPSSSFKKNSPSGYLGHITEIKEDDIMEIVEEAGKESLILLALNDGVNDYCIFETNLIDPKPSLGKGSY